MPETDESVELDQFVTGLNRMDDLSKIASSLAKTGDLPGALSLLNANGLSFRDTLDVHALVLSDRVLRSPVVEFDDARQHFAAMVRPDIKETMTA